MKDNDVEDEFKEIIQRKKAKVKQKLSERGGTFEIRQPIHTFKDMDAKTGGSFGGGRGIE